MLFLRSVNNHKHFQAARFDRDQVRRSFQNRGDPPSVYRVESVSVADRIAVLHCMYIRESPSILDYVLLPSELIESCGLVLTPTKGDVPHPLIQGSHHEIFGMVSEKLDLLCSKVEIADIPGKRLSKNDVRELARSEVADPLYGGAAVSIVLNRHGWHYLFEDER